MRSKVPEPTDEVEIPLPEPVYARDADLIRSCLAGDDAAWRTLLGRYHQLIYSIPRSYRLDADDSADVYQSVCLALWKGLPRLRSEKALTNWVLVTCNRLARRLAQERRRQVARGLKGPVAEDAIERLPARDVNPLASLDELQLKHQLHRALAQLPPRCADMLTRLYLVETPPNYDTLAIELEIPRGSLGPTRSRCLEKLKKLMDSL